MNISALAFDNRRLVWLVLVFMLAYGVFSYFTLPAREDPLITIREATVTTKFPGLSPSRVDELITSKLEQAIRRIPEIKEIRSSSTTGTSIIHVVIEDRYFALDKIWQDLRNKVNQARLVLPEGTADPVINDEFGDVSVITLALTGEGFKLSDLHDLSEHISDVLYTVEGTKKIDIFGDQEERIFLEMSNARLAQLGVSPRQMANALQTQNIIQPGGMVDTGNLSFIIEPTGNYSTLEDIGQTLISLPNGNVVPLSDIVSLERGYQDPPDRPSYFNGNPAIIFAISMLDGFNVLDFAPIMRRAIEEVEATLPVGVSLSIATYQADQVEKTVKGVSSSVGQTLVIVLLVVMIFLGIRTGFIVGIIVPFVMLATLACMNIFGLELERMSLATLIIALGLLVDNGIVIAEDFKRRLEEGDTRRQALEGCGKELAMPLLISSLTTILVFLPLMLAEHAAGEYTRSISLVILISLLTSWIMALCITPTLCFYFLKLPENDTQKDYLDSAPRENTTTQANRPAVKSLKAKAYNYYEKLLRLAIRWRGVFLSLTVISLIGSVFVMGFIPKQFFPNSNREQVLVYVELPAGTSSNATEKRMQDIFSWLNQKESFPQITSHLGHIGYGGPRFVLSLSPQDPSDNKGFIVLNVTSTADVDPTIKILREKMPEQFPDMSIRVSKMFLGPSDSSKLEVQVKGPDADIVFNKAEQIMDLFRSVPGTLDIRTNWENRITKIQVNVDQQRARRAGVTSEDIADSLSAFLSGISITEFREDDDIIPIVLRAEDSERGNLDRLRTINVYSAEKGLSVPLFQIADFEPVNQFSRLEREDLFRTITVEVKSLVNTAEDLKDLLDDDIQALAADLPLNHHIEYDGVIKESGQAQKALSASLPMVFGIIVVLLVAQFNSYRKPLIILLTIPLTLVGVAFGLLVTQSLFGFMVTLGLYSLSGIIINNAIVLIDRITIEQKNGSSDHEAIIKAALLRVRPIIMTTITTVLGLMPLIITRDPLFYGMANAMAFGLAVGTVMTLGVVPVLYATFYSIKSEKKTK